MCSERLATRFERPLSKCVLRMRALVESLLDLAERAARAAGDMLRERASGPAEGVSSKSSPTDLVSDADRDAEKLLIELISSERPDDGFVTEESEGRPSQSGIDWILDPLDGTVNFLFRIPWWCVSVAARDETGMVAGAIYQPNLDEMFSAARGKGAFLKGSSIQVSDRDTIDRAMIGTGFSYDPRRRFEQAAIVARVVPRARDIRRFGSAALDLAHVACGRLDGFYEGPLEEWDKAAGLLLVTEAGGVVTELPADGQVIASGPKIHDALVALVRGEGDQS